MFDTVVEAYKKMDLSDKREANLTELKKLIAIVEKMCVDKNIPYRNIKSKEILEYSGSYEDYLEAEFIYISYLKEVIWSYLASEFQR